MKLRFLYSTSPGVSCPTLYETDDGDQFLGVTLDDTPTELVTHNYWRDAAWHHAETFDTFNQKINNPPRTSVIPGLLQTADYARAMFTRVANVYNSPVDEGVAARMWRQQVLYEPGREFHFLVLESAPHIQLAPPEAMAGQLERIYLRLWEQFADVAAYGAEAHRLIARAH